MATPAEICIIPDCEQEVRYFHLHVCAACYSGLGRWRGRSAAQKRHNLGRCNRLVSRMEFIMGHPRHHPKRRGKKE